MTTIKLGVQLSILLTTEAMPKQPGHDGEIESRKPGQKDTGSVVDDSVTSPSEAPTNVREVTGSMEDDDSDVQERTPVLRSRKNVCQALLGRPLVAGVPAQSAGMDDDATEIPEPRDLHQASAGPPPAPAPTLPEGVVAPPAGVAKSRTSFKRALLVALAVIFVGSQPDQTSNSDATSSIASTQVTDVEPSSEPARISVNAKISRTPVPVIETVTGPLYNQIQAAVDNAGVKNPELATAGASRRLQLTKLCEEVGRGGMTISNVSKGSISQVHFVGAEVASLNLNLNVKAETLAQDLGKIGGWSLVLAGYRQALDEGVQIQTAGDFLSWLNSSADFGPAVADNLLAEMAFTPRYAGAGKALERQGTATAQIAEVVKMETAPATATPQPDPKWEKALKTLEAQQSADTSAVDSSTIDRVSSLVGSLDAPDFAQISPTARVKQEVRNALKAVHSRPVSTSMGKDRPYYPSPADPSILDAPDLDQISPVARAKQEAKAPPAQEKMSPASTDRLELSAKGIWKSVKQVWGKLFS